MWPEEPKSRSWVWWLILIISAMGRQRQADLSWLASLAWGSSRPVRNASSKIKVSLTAKPPRWMAPEKCHPKLASTYMRTHKHAHTHTI